MHVVHVMIITNTRKEMTKRPMTLQGLDTSVVFKFIRLLSFVLNIGLKGVNSNKPLN